MMIPEPWRKTWPFHIGHRKSIHQNIWFGYIANQIGRIEPYFSQNKLIDQIPIQKLSKLQI